MPTNALSGTISVADNVVVDTDTNDPNQQNRRVNDDFSSAQPLTAASQVVGYVNQALAGPTGANYTDGDEIDAFSVTLAAGQIIELDFTSDPSANDLDLYVFQSTGGTQKIVGQSIGTASNECIRITTAGDYTVAVQAFAGASSYSLRMTTPGAASACSSATTSALASSSSIVPGELIVRTRTGAAGALQAQAMATQTGMAVTKGSIGAGRHGLLHLPTGTADRSRALASLSASPGRKAVQGGRAATKRGLSLDATARLHFDTVAYAKRLRASGAYQYVIFNRTLSSSTAGQLVGTYPPSDPGYAKQQWNYEQISLPSAMQFVSTYATTTGVRPIVAVVDTGIVTDHPDLRDQVVPGYDFIADYASAGDGDGVDADPNDLLTRSDLPSFHGTHVAGIAAASTFNGVGGAGVAPMAQVMPIRVLGKGGSGTLYDIMQGLLYASGQANDSGQLPMRRADVANLSLGFKTAGGCDADSQAFFDSVRAAGTVVVVAAGNEANRAAGLTAPVSFPANCTGVIAVTATDAQRNVAPYANSGPQVAIAAPGGDMSQSTTGNGLPDGVYSTLAAFDATGIRVPSYGMLQGTSMAAPHVAGVIAMMRWIDPAITLDQIMSLLTRGMLTDVTDSPVVGARNDEFGYGILNARKAVEAAQQLKTGMISGAPPGILEASPSSLAFGTATTALEFLVRATATTGESVTSVVSNATGLGVTPVAVDAATGLGTYRATVDRFALPVGVNALSITIQTTSRTLTLNITVQKLAAGSNLASPDVGPVYVVVTDAASNIVLQKQLVQASGGRYSYSISGLAPGSVKLMAGTDIDNDGLFCGRGDACGAWPVLGNQLTTITLNADRAGLDFTLVPTGAINAGTTAVGAKVGSGGWPRK